MVQNIIKIFGFNKGKIFKVTKISFKDQANCLFYLKNNSFYATN